MQLNVVQQAAATILREDIVTMVSIYKKTHLKAIWPEDVFNLMEVLNKSLSLGLKEYKFSLYDLGSLGYVVLTGKQDGLLDEDYCVSVVGDK